MPNQILKPFGVIDTRGLDSGIQVVGLQIVFRGENRFIRIADNANMEIASSKPQIMGKMPACYTTPSEITSIYKDLSL